MECKGFLGEVTPERYVLSCKLPCWEARAESCMVTSGVSIDHISQSYPTQGDLFPNSCRALIEGTPREGRLIPPDVSSAKEYRCCQLEVGSARMKIVDAKEIQVGHYQKVLQ